MLRSENMSLKKIMFAKESMWETFNFLAKTERVMLVTQMSHNNLSHSSLSSFASEKLKRLDMIDSLITKIENTITEFKEPSQIPTHSTKWCYNQLDKHSASQKISGEAATRDAEVYLREKAGVLENDVANHEHLLQARVSLCDTFAALGLTSPGGVAFEATSAREEHHRIRWIVGLIPTEHLLTVQKLIFRISRENVVMRSANLPKMATPEIPSRLRRDKTLIWVCVPGNEQAVIGSRISTVFSKFDFSPLDLGVEIHQVKEALSENSAVLAHTEAEIRNLLQKFTDFGSVEEIPKLYELKLVFCRERSFTTQLVQLEEKDGFYEMSAWIPEQDAHHLEEALSTFKPSFGDFTRPRIFDCTAAEVKKAGSAPTRFSLPSFAEPFQLIVETYGMPRYKEANPGLFTIATFPFMFGLMFGDVGHGALLLALGIYLTFFMRDSQSPLNGVKHLILMLGFFAFYCGLIYNEFFSVPLVTSSSCYTRDEHGREFSRKPGCVYPIGLDYSWFQSANETLFVNSFKMKFAIVIGVVQMVMGICLKCTNAIHFRSMVDLFCEAIPQLVFMLVTFGYMVFCIIVKWLTSWENKQAPSIISLFINFYEVTSPLWTDAETQQAVQRLFIVIALVCVVLMFFPKPLIISLRNIHYTRVDRERHEEESLQHLMDDDVGHNSDHSEDFGELLVHQMIETVEFVLGSISNTASYLRLWALSLAHGQLSKVFLTMIFQNALMDNTNVYFLVLQVIFGFVFWAAVTAGIIMGMDSLECFLHALRLHWVEFQNKFFKGDGKRFEPFRMAL